jgi:chromosome segregation ATPase
MQDNTNTAEDIELVLPEDEESQQEETGQPVEAVAEQSEQKSELDEVSDNVKKRIDKLTYKMREAERQRDEALNYAKSVSSTNGELQEKLKNSDSSLFKEYDSRVQSDIERAKIHLKEAQDAGDAEGIANATESLSRASAEAENLKRLQAQQAIRDKKAEQSVQTQEPVQLQTNAPPAPDPKAEAWAKENSWFGQDTVMTFAAFGIHRELVEEQGYDPTSDEYYEEVNKRMRQNFPTKFSQEQQAPVQQVAASTPGVAGKKSARKVKLTPSQVAIAKRLGVPLTEYAKHIEGV